jgi:hypothetical protein
LRKHTIPWLSCISKRLTSLKLVLVVASLWLVQYK